MKTIASRLVMVLLMGACVFLSTAQAAPNNQQLVIGMSQEFDTMNPLISSMTAAKIIEYAVNRPLAMHDANWKAKCFLCTKIPTFENGLAKKIIDKDGKEKIIATWEIQPNAKWGDGVPVTGNDVKFSWIVARHPNVSVPSRDVYDRIEQITVDPTNPRRFTFKYSKAEFDYFLLKDNEIIPQHIEGPIFEASKNSAGLYEKQTAYVTNPTNPGLYAGPYVVQELKLGSHVTVVPNPNWYGDKPKIQRIIFKVVPSTQTLEANLVSGQIDMLNELGFSFDQALSFQKRMQPTDPYQVVIAQGATYEHIDLNLDNEILKDVRVRKALLYGVDRDKLVQALFEGKQKKAIHNVNPRDEYYTENVVLYPYDPAKAGQLLDEAGWKLGADGYRVKDAQKLSFTIMTTADNKTRELVEVFLQSEWKKIGIDLRIQNLPPRVFFADTTHKRAFQHMAMFAWVSGPDDPPDTTCLSTEIPNAANGWAGQNYTGWKNPKVDELLHQTLESFDVNTRKSLMQKMLYEYTNDVPTIPLYYRAEIAVIPKNLQGFALTGHNVYSTQAVEYWDLGQ